MIYTSNGQFFRRTGKRHPRPYEHWELWEPVRPITVFGITLLWLPLLHQEPFYLDDYGFTSVSRWNRRTDSAQEKGE